MFGTTRTLTESILDIIEGVAAIIIATLIFYLIKATYKKLSPKLFAWWQERSVQSTIKYHTKTSDQISLINSLKRDPAALHQQTILAVHRSLHSWAIAVGGGVLSFIMGIDSLALRLAPLFSLQYLTDFIIIASPFLLGQAIYTYHSSIFPSIENLKDLNQTLAELKKQDARLLVKIGSAVAGVETTTPDIHPNSMNNGTLLETQKIVE
jgi:hypothetical protein